MRKAKAKRKGKLIEIDYLRESEGKKRKEKEKKKRSYLVVHETAVVIVLKCLTSEPVDSAGNDLGLDHLADLKVLVDFVIQSLTLLVLFVLFLFTLLTLLRELGGSEEPEKAGLGNRLLHNAGLLVG